MAAEITSTDNFIGYQTGGWHGLGTVFKTQVKTADEALRLSKLGWNVEQWKLAAQDPDQNNATRPVETHVLNVRGDNHAPLGVVGSGYVPCQNKELAEFAFNVAAESGDALHLETAGSIRGGRRVWFMLAGAQFHVHKNEKDRVDTFLLAANGHDGGTGLWVTPTSTRVVCSNTLHAALSGANSHFRLRHEGNLESKIEQVRKACKLYTKGIAEFQDQCETLDSKAMKKDDLQSFFVEAWTRAEFAIPKNPKTEDDKRKVERAQEAAVKFAENVDADCAKVGRRGKPTLWTALNAFTQFEQHQKMVRGVDDGARLEGRVFNDLFGSTATAKREAFKLALALA